MATTKRRIHNKGEYLQEEANAAEAGIYPGMLVMLGSAGTLTKHATEGGRGEVAIAAEDALQGNTIATVYTILNPVTYLMPNKGSIVNVLIEAGQDIDIGDELMSAGNGLFKEDSDLDSGETLTQVLLYAMEACDLTASGAANTLCAARVA